MTSMDMPVWLSEYFAARAQSLGLISANALVDLRSASAAMKWTG
jgi:hypothetical protein